MFITNPQFGPQYGKPNLHLTAIACENQDGFHGHSRSRKSVVPRVNEGYISKLLEDREGRVMKNLPQWVKSDRELNSG